MTLPPPQLAGEDAGFGHHFINGPRSCDELRDLPVGPELERH